MNSISINPVDLARTFTLICRHDTHYFLGHDLPEFLSSLKDTNIVRLRNYLNHLRSGEYIPKGSYSDNETEYVYLTIGQFSGDYVSFEGLTFLEENVGRNYENIKVKNGDLVITRSGTVGTCHIFLAPDEKVYIPSHHLAILELDEDEEAREYLRLFLQTEFAKKYFWSFATGKSQKEISNWSIKSIPIPQTPHPKEVAKACIKIETEILDLRKELEKKQIEKEERLFSSIIQDS